jgi:hypothetical protein
MFKTTVKKLSELRCSDLRDLFTWPSGGSTIQADNPNVLIAKAANESGETVAFVSAEPVLLVNSFVLNPESNPIESQRAGNEIDRALAERAGVQRMWVVIPQDAPAMQGEKFIRVYERKVYQAVVNTQRSGCCELKQQPTQFN